MILNDAEIEAEMQALINATWPPADREKALRLGGILLDNLNAFFVEMGALKLQVIADRDAAQAALAAELAQAIVVEQVV